MSLRDDIASDFEDVCDDLETVKLVSRASRVVVRVCDHAKRSLKRDAKQASESMGFAVSDYITFQISANDLAGYTAMLGDWLLDETDNKYVVASVFHSKMTNRLRLKTVSLNEVLNSKVTITSRSEASESGALGARDIPIHIGVPARVWPVDQSDADYLGDDLKPRHRCAVFSDGQQVSLPLPQGAGLIDSEGNYYDITAVKQLDQLVGFVVFELSIKLKSEE